MCKKSLGGEANQFLASVRAVSRFFEVNKNEFVKDSGSTDHFAFDRNLFVYFWEKDEVILSPNGRQLQLNGVGKVMIEGFNDKGQKVRLQLEAVLYVPQYKFKLISIDKKFGK